MNEVRLIFKSISEVVGALETGLIILVDSDEQRQIAITCDGHMLDAFRLRMGTDPVANELLPEVLCKLLEETTDIDLEIRITKVVKGRYKAMLFNTDNEVGIPIRISDAILLAYTAHDYIPIYMDRELFLKQSSVYSKDGLGVSIPVNTLSVEMLEASLDKAVKSENYELASLLRDELHRRKSSSEEPEQAKDKD